MIFKNFRLKAWQAIIIGLLISFLGYFLRLQQFYSFPPNGDTQDELKDAFNGISLIKEGVPKSWSWYGEYGNFPVVHIRNSDFKIVEPWFDGPPLFSLIIGEYSILKNMTNFNQIDAGVLRYAMIKLSFISIFLLFLLVYILSGLWEAVIATLVFATEPTFVLASRLVVAENLLVTVSLVSLLLFLYFLKQGKNWIIVVTGLVAASAFLMKPTGIFISVSLIFLSIYLKKYKASAIVFSLLIVSIIAWLLYGAHYDWSLFLKINSAASGREINLPTNVMSLVEVFRIGEKSMSSDGWIIWGWISVVVYSLLRMKEKADLRQMIFTLTLGSYLAFFTIMSGHSKGWYRIPFYPFLAWSSAAFFLEILRKPRFLTSFFFITIPVSASYIFGTGGEIFNSFQIKIYQAVTAAVSLPMILTEIFSNKKIVVLVRVILISAFVLALLLNVRTIISFQSKFWYL